MKPAKKVLFTGCWIILLLLSLYQEGKAPEKIYWKSVIQKELPGPKDAWAGSQVYEIRIMQPLPQEEALLRIHTQDAHNQYPPKLEIVLNHLPVGEIQIKPGLGNPAHKEGLAGTYSLPIKISPDTLREMNEILIKNTRGSWVRLEAIELTSVKTAFSLKELYKSGLSSYQVFFFWLLALGLCWGLFWQERSLWFYSLIALSYAAILVFFNLYSINFPGMWGFGAFLYFPKGIKIGAAYLLIGFFLFSYPSRLRLKTWHKAAALGTIPILFFLIRSFNDPPDGAQWVRFVPEGVFYHREPLATYIQHLFYVGVKSFIPNPREALSFLSILLGVLGTFFLWKWAESIFDTIEDQVFFTLSILASFGFVGLFLGHIETYPILVVALIGYLWSVSLCLKKRGHPKWPTLWLSLAFIIHLGTAWLVPAHIYLLIVRIRNEPSGRLKIFGDLVLYALLPVFLTLGLMLSHGSSITSWVKDLFHIFPGNTPPFYAWKEILNPNHLKDVINEHFYLAPSLLLLLLFVRMNALKNPLVFFLFLAFLSFELYTLSFKPGLGAQRDWDLFSPLTLLALGYLWSSL
ncbi:MAG: hypothetical protein C0407_14085, partial [Desulfobacca sp.]|nr:hypothetical protein [Desulfobacca sp.]